MVDDHDKQGPADDGGPVALVRRAVRRIQALPEVPRVFALAGLILGGILAAVLLLAYRVAIWRAITLLFAVLLSATVLGLLVVGARVWVQARARRRGETPPQESASAGSPEPVTTEPADERTALLQAIVEGRVEPITEPVALLLRDAEVLWYCCQAWRRMDEEEHAGELYVTSHRVAFISETAPFEVAVGNVNAVRCDDEELRLIGSSSLESCNFLVTDAELTAAYIGCAARASRQRGDAGAELR